MRTILVVDDEHDILNLVQAALTREGFAVVVAENGDNALEAFEKLQSQVDLLLTDVVMPGMSGRDLARRIAQMAPHIRVLFMSGYTDNVIAQGGTLEPGLAFLQKPFTPVTLGLKVREVLDARAVEAVNSRQSPVDSKRNPQR